MGKMLIFGVKKTQLLHDTQLDYTPNFVYFNGKNAIFWGQEDPTPA